MRKFQAGIEREDVKSWNDPLKQEYEDYLRNQRGLSERTISHCWRFADRFLQFRFAGKTRDLHKITPTDIVRFMQQLVSRG
jgi:integrase/recombinase XerD